MDNLVNKESLLNIISITNKTIYKWINVNKVSKHKILIEDVITTLVSGLVKDRKEALEKEIKVELIGLLDKHVELKKSIEAKKKELKQLEESKMKEFNEAASKLFAKIDDVQEIEKDYYTALNATGNPEGGATASK